MAFFLGKVRPQDLRAISGLSAVIWLMPYLYLVSRMYKAPWLGVLLLDRERAWFMIAPFCHALGLALFAWATRRMGGGKAMLLGLVALCAAAVPPLFFLYLNRQDLAEGAGKAFISLLPLLIFWTGYLAVSGWRSANQVLAVAYAMAATYNLAVFLALAPHWPAIFSGAGLARLAMFLVSLLGLAVNQTVLLMRQPERKP